MLENEECEKYSKIQDEWYSRFILRQIMPIHTYVLQPPALHKVEPSTVLLAVTGLKDGLN